MVDGEILHGFLVFLQIDAVSGDEGGLRRVGRVDDRRVRRAGSMCRGEEKQNVDPINHKEDEATEHQDGDEQHHRQLGETATSLAKDCNSESDSLTQNEDEEDGQTSNPDHNVGKNTRSFGVAVFGFDIDIVFHIIFGIIGIVPQVGSHTSHDTDDEKDNHPND